MPVGPYLSVHLRKGTLRKLRAHPKNAALRQITRGDSTSHFIRELSILDVRANSSQHTAHHTARKGLWSLEQPETSKRPEQLEKEQQKSWPLKSFPRLSEMRKAEEAGLCGFL